MNLAEKEAELVVLNKQWEEAEQQISAIATRANALKEEINNQKLTTLIGDKPITPEIFMSLDWNLVTFKWFQVLDQWFRDNYRNKGLYKGTVWSETDQVALQVMFDQNYPLDDQLGILDFLPFIKPTKKGAKLVGIFEHTCSQYASWMLEIFEDRVELIRTRWTDRKFKDLQEALHYVYQHHPYKLKEKSYKDED